MRAAERARVYSNHHHHHNWLQRLVVVAAALSFHRSYHRSHHSCCAIASNGPFVTRWLLRGEGEGEGGDRGRLLLAPIHTCSRGKFSALLLSESLALSGVWS